MSEELISKIKRTFEESIVTKQALRVKESHIAAGHVMLRYTEDTLLDIGYLEKS